MTTTTTAIIRTIILSTTLGLATLVHAQPEVCQGRYVTDGDVELGAGTPAARALTTGQRISLDGPKGITRAYFDRIMKPTGTLLLCEETDVTLEAGDREHGELGYTCGRGPEVYGRWLAPWRLVAAKPRVIEPDYPRPDVGSYMLFVGPDADWTGVLSR